jgi:hypothetical protein
MNAGDKDQTRLPRFFCGIAHAGSITWLRKEHERCPSHMFARSPAVKAPTRLQRPALRDTGRLVTRCGKVFLPARLLNAHIAEGLVPAASRCPQAAATARRKPQPARGGLVKQVAVQSRPVLPPPFYSGATAQKPLHFPVRLAPDSLFYGK